MRVILCGSREWEDGVVISVVIEGLWERYGSLVVVHGAARGADTIAGNVARGVGIPVEEHPADWKTYNRAAGPKRNAYMLGLGAGLVVAFKDGFDHSLSRGGTENMVKIARAAGVPTWVVSH